MRLILAGLILLFNYTALSQEQQKQSSVELELSLDQNQREGGFEFDLVLDFSAPFDKNRVGSILNNLVQRLNVHYRQVTGQEGNRFAVYWPLRGFTKNRFGRNENAISTYGITILGARKEKTFFLKKINNHDLKFRLTGKVLSSYILFNQNRYIDCPDCITTAATERYQYLIPRALDLALEGNINLSVEYRKFALKAYYRGFQGIGWGDTYGISKDYPNFEDNKSDSVYSHTDGHLGVKFRQKLSNSQVGVRFSYELIPNLEIYGSIENNTTKFIEKIREEDLSGIHTEIIDEKVIFSDGSTGIIQVEKKHDVFQNGHSQDYRIDSKNLNFGIGLKYRFNSFKRKKTNLSFY